MEGLNGLETCRAVHIRHPEVKMVALSMLKEPGLIKQMLKNGASGYLLKDAGMDEVLRAVRAVHAGKQYQPGSVGSCITSLSAKEPPKKCFFRNLPGGKAGFAPHCRRIYHRRDRRELSIKFRDRGNPPPQPADRLAPEIQQGWCAPAWNMGC